MTLSAKQIGYLRLCPSSRSAPQPLSGSVKAMANKLEKKKFVALLTDGYRRTPKGDKAIADFDAALSDECVRVLRVVLGGNRAVVVALLPGVQKLIDAGLIRIRNRAPFQYVLTEAGQQKLAK